jgi:hypothetical protein
MNDLWDSTLEASLRCITTEIPLGYWLAAERKLNSEMDCREVIRLKHMGQSLNPTPEPFGIP